ncbi:DsbE family thiol:disulfide interchange protein [Marinomonas agarivorans]|nr:DsbE family thiol:disulfide interchange protein [Marinomonas agarivorans]
MTRTRKMALFLPFLVFALLAGMFFSQLGKDTQYMPSALIGQPIPDFTLVELQTNKVLTHQDLNQQGPYLINFWGTWCPACSYEHEYLMTLAEQGITIIGIDYKDEPDKALVWLEERGNPYHLVLLDELGNFGLDMGVTGAPETFVVNSDGIITYRHQGIVNAQVWQEMKEFL